MYIHTPIYTFLGSARGIQIGILLDGIARNFVEWRGIARELNGLQLRTNEIQLRWKP